MCKHTYTSKYEYEHQYQYQYKYVYVCIYINSLILGTRAPSLKHQMAEICCRGEVAKFGGLTQVNWT